MKRNHSKRARHIILPNVIFHVQVPREDRLSIGGKHQSTACGYGDSPHYVPQITNRFSAQKITTSIRLLRYNPIRCMGCIKHGHKMRFVIKPSWFYLPFAMIAQIGLGRAKKLSLKKKKPPL